MNIKIIGKDITATDSIKAYIEKKCERISKYFDSELDVQVTIKSEGVKQVAEMRVYVNGDIYIAATESKDLYASIDKNIDIIEGQIRKMKTKKDKQNMNETIRIQENITFDINSHEVENEILKTLYYDIKPMTPEDAKLVLSDKPQNLFLTFINVDTGKVNVIFKLKDGKNYGLVEPEA